MLPLLLAISLIKSIKGPQELSQFIILFFFPYLTSFFGYISLVTVNKFLPMKKYSQFTVACVLSGNNVALPFTMAATICETNNTISAMYSGHDQCLADANSSIAIYSLGSNLVIYVLGRYLVRSEVFECKKGIDDDYHLVHDSPNSPSSMGSSHGSSSKSIRSGSVQSELRSGITWQNIFPIQVLSSLFGLTVSFITPLRDYIDSSDQSSFGYFLQSVSFQIGNCAVPIFMLLLGASMFALSAQHKIPKESMISLLLSKLIIVPLLTLLTIWAFEKLFHIPAMPKFMALSLSAMPTTVSITAFIEELNVSMPKFRSAAAVLILSQYLLSIVTLSIWNFIFLNSI